MDMIHKIAKTMTYNEFLDEFSFYHDKLCPSIFNLKDKEEKECYDTECDLCWQEALKDIKFKE